MLKTAIVGAGYWGPNIARNLAALSDLVAICDKDLNKAAGLAKKLNVYRVTDTIDQLPTDLDAVAIVTPPSTHEELAVEFLKKGIPVFIEKPLAHTLESALRIKEAADQARLPCMVGHTFLFSPPVQAIKELLTTGEIGVVRGIYTTRGNLGKYQPCGVIKDLLPHDISIANYWLDSVPKKANAIRASFIKGYEDVAAIHFTYPNASVVFNVSWTYHKKERVTVIVGSRGMIEWDMADYSNINIHRGRTYSEENGHVLGMTQKFYVEDQSEPLHNELLHFLDCILKKRTPLSSIDAGVEVVRAIEMV